MAGGPERDGTQRRGWLHRRRHHRHRSPAPPPETTDVAATERDDAGDDAPEPGPQASLDQVLRRAAEARDAEPDDEPDRDD